MKKISFFALLVLTGMFFVTPALQAQEAAEAAAPEAQEAQAPETEDAEAQKKAKALAVAEDDDQTGNFMTAADEDLLAIIDAIFEQFNTDGGDFYTGNPVNNTSHTEKGDDDDDSSGSLSRRPFRY